jgi:hypothetical protein
MAQVLGLKPGSIGSQQIFDLRSRSLRREYFATYVVQASSLLEREISIVSTPGIPLIGQFWSGGFDIDFGAKCLYRDPIEVDSGAMIWEVETRWTTDLSDEAEEDKPPELRTPDWRWDTETIDRVLTKDPVTGEAIVNSVGEPLLVTVPYPITTLTITRYKTQFDASEKAEFENHVNTGAFWGFAAGKCLLSRITDDPESVDGRKLRRVSYTVKIKDDDEGWDLELLDYGTKYLDGADEVPFLAGDVPTSGRLNGSGAPSATDVFLTFNRFKTADLNSLDLGPFA